MNSWTAIEGTPIPLGATWNEQEQAYNFALYSKHAETVTLLLYGRDDFVNPLLSRPLDYLRNKSGRIWHCRILKSAVEGAEYYAYRVGGPAPRNRFEWHCYDPEKILLDPYAESVLFPPTFERGAAARPRSNAGRAPLAVLNACQHAFEWKDGCQRRHEADTVIYELHVRGFTLHPSSGVSTEKRGTYAGLVEKIPYDLVSYSRKRHAANGHNNIDGADENYSWHCGWEGEMMCDGSVSDSKWTFPRIQRAWQ